MEWIRGALSPGWVGSAISLTGLLVGLISIVAALLIYRASRVGGRLAYQRHCAVRISSTLREVSGDVEIRFRGRRVPHLTKTLLVIWNSGKATIRGRDIVSDDPVQFAFPNGSEILHARLLKATRPHIKFEVTRRADVNNAVTCSFDYLDPRDGAAIEILHTSVERYPLASGTIRGVPTGICDAGRVLQMGLHGRSLIRFYWFPIVLAWLGLLLVMGSMMTYVRLVQGGPPRPGDIVLLLYIAAFAGLLLTAPALYVLGVLRRRFPKSLSLEDLED